MMSNKRDTTAVSPEHAWFLSSVKKADRRVTFFRYFILIAALILWEHGYGLRYVVGDKYSCFAFLADYAVNLV